MRTQRGDILIEAKEQSEMKKSSSLRREEGSAKGREGEKAVG